jgi:polyhydroxyalkanoate synthase
VEIFEMTTEDNESAVIPEVLKQNIETLEELNQRFVSVLQNKKQINPSLNGPGQDLMVKASHAYWSNFMENPANLMEKQISYWGKTLEYFVDAQHAFTQGQFQIPKADGKPDHRFTHEMWSSNPYFNCVKEHYLRTADLINSAISDLDGMELKEKRRLEFFTRQIVDMMSPTNFLATNPDALERAMETQGQSLIDGMQNLIADLEANEGELVVRLADESAFEVGGNIATAKGSVVFRNEMLELIQYAPTTETVYETPIIMFPPWINKYYILDLKEQNSLIRWVVDQGYTLFVVSWVNPDASYADIGMEDYIEHGYLKSIEVVKEITDQPQVNAIGYCIAGTTLALTLSLLKQRKDDSVKSATFFTALTDFSEQREFTPFLQNDFIDAIEDEINDKGILESFIMARTFSFLRANDLVYGPAVKSYMMGEAPPRI